MYHKIKTSRRITVKYFLCLINQHAKKTIGNGHTVPCNLAPNGGEQSAECCSNFTTEEKAPGIQQTRVTRLHSSSSQKNKEIHTC